MTTETQATTGTTPTDPGTQAPAAEPATQDSTVLTADTAASEQQAQSTSQGEAEAGDKADADAKPEGEKPKAEGDKPSEAKGAPEQYEDFTAPEGVALDAELVGDLKAIAKELNLSQKDAQRVADLGPKLMEKLQKGQAEALAQIRQTWADSAKADKEIGGEAFAENLGAAKKALDSFGTPELRTLLNESGIGNHPEVIRFMARAGKAISSDTFVPGGQRSGPTDPAKTMFPNMN